MLVRHDLAVERAANGDFTVTAESADMVAVAAALQAEPIIALAEPDLITPRRLLDVLPDDLRLARQWHLEDRGEIDGETAGLARGADARVVAAWRRLGHLGLAEAVVTLIDDGVDLTHPEAAGSSIKRASNAGGRTAPRLMARRAWTCVRDMSEVKDGRCKRSAPGRVCFPPTRLL